jgi:sugar phosphate isomerase/epimerase
MGKIDLGITLYCFTSEYYNGDYSLEDCIRAAGELGVSQFEIVGAQMLPTYPYVTDEFQKVFQEMCQKYGVSCISYGANMDRGMRADRNLTEDEMLKSTINDIKTANRLGAKVMRAQYLLSPNVMARVAPYAEEFRVKVGIEIHNPETPSTPIMQEYFETYQKVGSKYIGFVPDFGAFATKPNISVVRALENGANKAAMEYAIKAQYEKLPRNEVRQKLVDMGADQVTMRCFEEMNGFLTFYKEPDLEGLKRIMPYVVHFHGKFHYMHEDLYEESIPYGQILPVIQASDFDGCIVSEYEGHENGKTYEMVRRHLEMERKILGAL